MSDFVLQVTTSSGQTLPVLGDAEGRVLVSGGAVGAEGPAGPAGPEGPAGPTGPAGPQAVFDPDITGGIRGNVVAVPDFNIDCSAGNYFTKAISGNSYLTVSNVPASRSYSFTLEITHTSGVIYWFSGVEWPNATAPTLTTGKTHLFVFVTDDGGTRWRAAALIDYNN